MTSNLISKPIDVLNINLRYELDHSSIYPTEHYFSDHNFFNNSFGSFSKNISGQLPVP